MKVSANIKNVGSVEGTRNLALWVDRIKEGMESVTLEPGESTTLVYSVKRQDSGTYTVRVGDETDDFRVTKPAKFRLTDLDVSPSKPRPGENVTVSVNVSNIGDVKGSTSLELAIDGTVQKNRVVTVPASESKNISFSIQAKKEGIHNVEISELTGQFNVIRLAAPPKLIKGRGSAEKPIALENGYSIFEVTFEGNGVSDFELKWKENQNIIGYEQDRTVYRQEPLVSGNGSYSASTVSRLSGSYALSADIDGTAPWRVKVREPRPVEAPTSPTFSGKGEEVVGPLCLENGKAKFKLKHKGLASVFLAYLVKWHGDRREITLIDGEGNIDRTRTMKVPENNSGIYYIWVKYGEKWKIKVVQ